MKWTEFLKLGAESRKQRLERANQMAPDESDVLHTFGNGYSIRRLTTNRDKYREGCLNGLCWAPGGATPQGQPTERETMPYVNNPKEGDKYYMSLRDPHNLPVASFYSQADREGTVRSFEIEGNHNSPVKPDYVDMIGSWHYHASPHAKENKAGEMSFHTSPDHPKNDDIRGGYAGYKMKQYRPEHIKNIQDSSLHEWEEGAPVAITDPNGNVLDSFGRVKQYAPKKKEYTIESPLFGTMKANPEEMANQTGDMIQFHHSPYDAHKPAKTDVAVDVPDIMPEDWGMPPAEGSKKIVWRFQYFGES